MSELQVEGSPREQSSGEILAWDFDWTNRLEAGQGIAQATALIIQINNGADETARCLVTQPSVEGTHVTIVVQSLTVGKRYRVTSRCTLSDQTVQDADLLLEVPH